MRLVDGQLLLARVVVPHPVVDRLAGPGAAKCTPQQVGRNPGLFFGEEGAVDCHLLAITDVLDLSHRVASVCPLDQFVGLEFLCTARFGKALLKGHIFTPAESSATGRYQYLRSARMCR